MICQGLSREKANSLYLEVLGDRDTRAMRQLCVEDLFFLLTMGCKRKDIDRDWLYDRCREVEASPNGYLDLWARDHYKSTIITFGMSIKDILADPDVTIGIFSHTRPIAKGFLSQIKRELETNSFLKDLFTDILYQRPEVESPTWSLDNGILVKRKTNPKENTVEAWGLVDGQPTSKHYKLKVYDDVVTRESVTTTEQIAKTTEAWGLSRNLGTDGGKDRYVGTRYHANDTYRTMMDRGSASPRIYAATQNGNMEGEPVLLSKETLSEKRRDMGPYIFSCQMLQDPVADRAMSFKPQWRKTYTVLKDTSKWNKYILVDPAGEKKQNNDYTVMEVHGLAPDNNYYLLDAVRDRLNLTERTNKLLELHRKWQPVGVGYEKYGKDSDIEHIRYVMEQENYRFNITPLGGGVKKNDRIKKLIPIYEQGRFWTPVRLMFTDYEGRERDYIQIYNEDEYDAFPVVVHDDMMDCRARILEPALGAKFPKAAPKPPPQTYQPPSGPTGWMG